MRTTRLALWIFIATLFVLPASAARADTGPKPTMAFHFVQAFSGQTIHPTEGIQYECDQADCSDAQPLKELGPQRFTCDGLGCRSLAYGYSTYHRIEIQFSDGKTRTSNVFQTAGFDSNYQVRVRLDDLEVQPEMSMAVMGPIVLVGFCCACLVGLVFLGGLIALFIRQQRAAKATAA